VLLFTFPPSPPTLLFWTDALKIILGGQAPRNKYLINGYTKTNTDVANLFQSVQLNVNNPHFLIMQGKITKVLNMKPPEILAMIEEACGTRMFEEKKEKAMATLEKKENKLQETTAVCLFHQC
jgi:structural maintenance of chromosome 2